MTKEEERFLKAVGVVILARRNDLGIKQEDLAKKVKISRPRLIRIEKGQNEISIIVLRRIAKELGLEFENIIKGL